MNVMILTYIFIVVGISAGVGIIAGAVRGYADYCEQRAREETER